GKDALPDIHRGFSVLIKGMKRHNAHRRGRVHKHCSHRSPIHRSPITKTRGIPHPTVYRREDPPAIVIGQPAPRQGAHEAPAKKWIVIPIAKGEWRPTHPHSKRPPAVAVSSHGKPGTVGVEITKS